MRLFSKKKHNTVDITRKCKETYQEINKILQDANREGDLEIRLSLLQLASVKYQDVLSLIEQGAELDATHFKALKKNVDDEIELYKEM
jgi:hypothetical protein